jgi:hypothetical protein
MHGNPRRVRYALASPRLNAKKQPLLIVGKEARECQYRVLPVCSAPLRGKVPTRHEEDDVCEVGHELTDEVG